MPEQVDECVKSVLADNPDMDESRAFAICKAELQAVADRVEVATLTDLDLTADHLDELAASTAWKATDGVWHNPDEQLAVYDAEAAADALATEQPEGFAADVFRVVQTEDSELDLAGDVMGIGVDFPNAGVYVDWRIEAWPEDEQLDAPHVSDYGSIADLEQATGGEVEHLTVGDGAAPATPTDRDT